MWTWPASTFQPWPYQVQKTRARLSRREGVRGVGWWWRGLHLALIGCQACLYCLGQKEYPPCPQPTNPQCLQTVPNSLSFLQALLCPHNLLCVRVRACVLMCTDVLHCVSWHIIKGNSSEREKLNRAGSVPWICSGWHPSILLCVWFLPTVILCISLVLSVLYYWLIAHRTPIWSMRTPICLEFTELIVEVCKDLELLSSQASGN